MQRANRFSLNELNTNKFKSFKKHYALLLNEKMSVNSSGCFTTI